MNKNYLTQVVWLVVLTIGILMMLSLLPPINTPFSIKQIDILSDLRTPNSNNPLDEDLLAEETDTTSITLAVDSIATLADNLTTLPDSIVKQQIVKSVKRKSGETTLIEDYSMQQNGLHNFKAAIENRNHLQRPVRIAFLGDSFIEADIFTQNVRMLLQDLFGGCGVGYMAMHSDFPGFRRSITQSDKGWKTANVISPKPPYNLLSLPLQHHSAEGEAYTRLKGVNKLRHIDQWEVSTLGFIAQDSAVISIKTDSASYSYEVGGSKQAQFITVDEPTSSLEVRCSNPQVAMWGTWLDGRKGIAVDNISMRGYSGTSLELLETAHLQELYKAIPYDLIVLQYGLNRMTPSITDYTPYTHQLINAIAHLRQAFPHTDILIMGIGDRCQNENGEIKTMPAIYGMRKAQRNAAIEAECLFWDCCEAMKQIGGMPTFVENNWASKDYTHINHQGGAPLAEEFIKAIKHALDNNPQPHIAQPTDTTIGIYE
ncbi:MAG: hypothetical protein IKY75_02120 [Bacteroidaceae bacterium]|nr:hypothetical protein [Bacteroidaceae bacterium]